MLFVSDLDTYKDVIMNNYKVIVIFCKIVIPNYYELAYKHYNILFVIIIINDKTKDVSNLFNISSFPSYYCYHNTNLIRELKELNDSIINKVFN